MTSSRLIGPYDEIISNLMEDLGVNAQIVTTRSYYIHKGRLCTEPDSLFSTVAKAVGYDVPSTQFAVGTAIKRTINSLTNGAHIKDTIMEYIESHSKSVINVSKSICDQHKTLSAEADIHHHNLLSNFTNAMEQSIPGLENMQAIYREKGDERFVAKMSIILQSLRDQIVENRTTMGAVPDGGATRAPITPQRGAGSKSSVESKK
jgi:hypothetical protein